MLVIRLKGKHIVISGIMIVALCLTGYAAIARRSPAKAENVAGEPQEYLQYLRSMYPDGDDVARELYFSAAGDVGQEAGMLFILPMMTWSPGVLHSEQDLQRGMEKFQLVLEHYPDSPWAKHSLQGLGSAYFQLGEYDAAEKYLKQSVEAGDVAAAAATELLARLYLMRGESQKALALVEKSLAAKPVTNPLEMNRLKGEALMALGEWDKAREVFLALPSLAEALLSRNRDQEANAVANNLWEKICTDALRRIDLLEKAAKTCTISGRVLLEGRGLANARVYLVDNPVNSGFSTGYLEYLPYVVTGEDGKFEFQGLPPGRYALGLGVRLSAIEGYTFGGGLGDIVLAEGDRAEFNLEFVPKARVLSPAGGQVIKGKVEFKWTKVTGAHSYNLVIGPAYRSEDGSISSGTRWALKWGIDGTSVEVDLDAEVEKARLGGLIVHTDEGIDPRSVLGLIHYGGEYVWGVEAYDEKGVRISDSFGFGGTWSGEELPLFAIAGKESLGKADRLLLERRYEEAIEAYEKALLQDPQDKHALLVLARLHGFGIHWEKADPALAARYYARLLELEDTPELRKWLAAMYLQSGENQKAYDTGITVINAGHGDWSTCRDMARAAFRLGRLQEAARLADLALNMENGEHIGAFPVALALVRGDAEKALSYAGRVNGGERYRSLLAAWKESGPAVPRAVLEALPKGEYRHVENLVPGEQGKLLKGLMLYLEGAPDCRERIGSLLAGMEQGLPRELLEMVACD